MKHSRLSVFSFSAALVLLLVWALTFIGCGSNSNKTTQTTPPPAPGTPPPSGGTTGSSGGSTSGGTTTGSTTGSTTGGSTTGGTTTGSTTSGGSGTGGSSGGSGSTGSGTGSTGGSGSGTGGGTSGGGTTGSGGSSSISGTIVDAQSNAPIDGTVNVLLEGSGGGEARVLMQTTADANGHFQFDNVSPSPRIEAIMTSALGSDGTFYTPALLTAGNGSCSGCGSNTAAGGDPITPGTDVGTIPLQHSSTTGFMDGTVSSSDTGNNNPVAVRVTASLMTTFVLDQPYPVALLFPPQEFETNAAVRSCGDGHGACAAYTFQVPTDRVQWAVFSHNGYSFSPRNEFTNYKPIFSAFSLDTGEPDCNPSTTRAFGATFGPFVSPSGTAIVSTDKFENCQ